MSDHDARDVPTVRSTRPVPAPGRTPSASTEEFSQFYRSFLPVLVAFLRWQGVPLREASDLAQETMVRAYRYWSAIEHPPAWARRVAARMWARRVAETVEDPVAEVPEHPPLLTITDIAEWEQRHEVLRLLDRLPPRQRQVLAWRLDGYEPSEIAAELKMTTVAVRASLFKARQALAAQLRATEEQP